METVLLVQFVVIGVIVIAVFLWRSHRRRVLQDGLLRLCGRGGWQPTPSPCGLLASDLVGRSSATPRGDRRYGLRFAIERPVEVELDGRPTRVDVASFEWWYEQRVRTHKHTRYHERRVTVALVQLPVLVPGRIHLRSERVLGRVGLTREDQQLESEEFNRRFHVDGPDPQLTVRFLDAEVQHHLLTRLPGRTVLLEGHLLLLGGTPGHRDDSLPGVIGELPAVVQDVTALLRAVPSQLWRLAMPPTGVSDDRGRG